LSNDSIDKLSRALHGALSDLDKTTLPRVAAFRGLWRIREGTSRLPMLIIHGGNANHLIQEYLPSDQSLYGYRHQGSDGEPFYHTTVEALAERCHAEWSEAWGSSPCIIVGHSFGGLVAYHLVHLRRQVGIEDPLLVMIDSHHPSLLAVSRPPENLESPGRVRQPHILRGWVDRMINDDIGDKVRMLRLWASVRTRLRMAWAHPGALAMAPRKLYDCIWNRTIELANARFARGERLPPSDRDEYLIAIYELAARAYIPPESVVDTLFLYARSLSWVGTPAITNWKQSIRGPFEAHQFAGTHLSIVNDAKAFAPFGFAIQRRVEVLRRALGDTD
jgi:thioesterase domain-containing protein